MIRKAVLIPTQLLILASIAAYAASPVEIVKQAQQAGKYVSFRGTKIASVYFAGSYTTSTMKVLHQKPDKTRTDFFTPDAIAGVIVIQDGNSIWTFSPDSDTWEQRVPSINYSADRLSADLTRNFDLKITGKDSVAGRSTYVIHAMPRSRGEAPRRIWVDEESYLVMKMQVEDPRGAVLNASRFTAIDINPDDISPDAFRVTGKIAAKSKPAPYGFQPVIPKYLPSGYKLIATSSITVNDFSCAHLQFSNGTNLISLFERKAGKDSETPPAPIRSKTTNVLTWTHDGLVFTLIGDIQSKELSKIADSMR